MKVLVINNIATLRRAKRKSHNPPTGAKMRRAKRDGRNPAIGA
ncbi:MAG TPA: hypothetical protein PLJ42_11395 [Chitinophagales bacterium]|nr:hypothetical protein [Chitinophagales bacterium]HQW80028.1 hypothetical protein [Chitinophagales bacterium]HRB66462.1 hypothetical protein [Chitinophagales bacterium]HRB69117.1 hypothetical protein [Chitinophagales bacterium]